MKSPAGRDSLDELCQAALWRACVDGGVAAAHELMGAAEALVLRHRAAGA